MDWGRIIIRGACAFVLTGGGARSGGGDWEAVIISGLVAAVTTIEALMATSANPAKRPDELPVFSEEEKKDS